MNNSVSLSFISKEVNIQKIKKIGIKPVSPVYKPKGLNAYFPDSNSMEVQGNTIRIENIMQYGSPWVYRKRPCRFEMLLSRSLFADVADI